MGTKHQASSFFLSLLPFTAAIFFYNSANAIDSVQVKAAIQKIERDKKFSGMLQLQQVELTAKFYQLNRFEAVWLGPGAGSRIGSLLTAVNQAGDYLLSPSLYRVDFLTILKKKAPSTATDSLYAEIKCTDAALSLLHDVAYGEGPPVLRYNGMGYHPNCMELPGLLAAALQNDNIEACVKTAESPGEKYKLLKDEFKRLLAVKEQKGFKEITVGDKTIEPANMALTAKLKQLGLLEASDSISKNQLLAAINILQRQHNLLVQNKINQYALEVLNETIADKLKELQWNIRWYRWLNCMRQNQYIVLNLPANRLAYVNAGAEKFTCKVVVGKISTPTPTLASSIQQVIYYPYWNVPYSIAVKEVLPAIRRNSGYLTKNHYEVLQGGIVVNPGGINWWQYSAKHFPFDIRQLPGCDNALGRLKFDFENPFSVYLHDTNNKTAFSAGKRFFSHGCMRVEKPYELALAIGVDAKKINMDSCRTGVKPQVIPLEKPVPVFVIYATVDVVNGELVWFEDAYHKREKN
jgi:L,D-transpeptidase YcbB